MTQAARLRKPSVWVLFATNAVPLLGVLFLDWTLTPILLLYWAESAVIGIYNVLKMIRVGGAGSATLVLFFIVHYGIFMTVHLGFLVAFLVDPHKMPGYQNPLYSFDDGLLLTWWGALAGLFVSHGISYATNFLGKREYDNTTVNQQMFAPYTRIVVMHLSILFGAFLVMFLDAPTWVLVLLVCLKTGADVRAHVVEHARASGRDSRV